MQTGTKKSTLSKVGIILILFYLGIGLLQTLLYGLEIRGLAQRMYIERAYGVLALINGINDLLGLAGYVLLAVGLLRQKRLSVPLFILAGLMLLSVVFNLLYGFYTMRYNGPAVAYRMSEIAFWFSFGADVCLLVFCIMLVLASWGTRRVGAVLGIVGAGVSLFTYLHSPLINLLARRGSNLLYRVMPVLSVVNTIFRVIAVGCLIALWIIYLATLSQEGGQYRAQQYGYGPGTPNYGNYPYNPGYPNPANYPYQQGSPYNPPNAYPPNNPGCPNYQNSSDQGGQWKGPGGYN